MMGRSIVFGLAAVAVLLVVVLLATTGRNWLPPSLFGAKENTTPTIMIVSRQVLQESAQANLALDELVKVHEAAVQKPTPAGAKPQAGKDTDARSAAEPGKGTRTAAQIDVLISAMEDAVGGKVSEAFANSRRFRLIPQAKIIDAMDAYAQVQKMTLSDIWSGFRLGSSDRAQTTPAKSEQANAPAPKSGIEELSRGLPDVARKVGADFTLVVTIGEPNIALEWVREENHPDRLVISAQPIVNCEIFDSRGAFVYRLSRQLDRPVVQSVSMVAGEPVVGESAAAANKFNDHLAAEAAQMVLEWVLDKLAPARIVQAGDELVINRGANDGIKEGAVYDVEREKVGSIQEEDSGTDLGRIRFHVGSIVIESVQERISTARTASDGPFAKNDIVVMPKKRVVNSVAPVSQGGRLQQSISVAVDHVSVGDGSDSQDLGETVSGALAVDPRVSVLARAELAKLRSERALNERAAGDFNLSSDEGLLQSSYLVSGECSTSTQRHDQTISISGVTKIISSHQTASSRCTLRASSVEGWLVAVASGSGGSPHAAAEDATKSLLPKLLSAVGMTPSTAEAPVTAAPPPAEAAAAPKPERPRRSSRSSKSSGSTSNDPEIHF